MNQIDEILHFNVWMAYYGPAMHEYAVKVQNHPYLFRSEMRARDGWKIAGAFKLLID